MNADETLIVQPDDPEYLLLAAAEAAFWSKQHPAGMESWEEQLTDGPADLYVENIISFASKNNIFTVISNYFIITTPSANNIIT